MMSAEAPQSFLKASFYIVNTMADLVLSVKDQSMASGAQLIVEPRNLVNNIHQRWAYDDTGGIFMSELNTHVLSISGGQADRGAKIVVEKDTGAPYQRWKVFEDSTIRSEVDGYYQYMLGLEGRPVQSGTPAMLTLQGFVPEDYVEWGLELAS